VIGSIGLVGQFVRPMIFNGCATPVAAVSMARRGVVLRRFTFFSAYNYLKNGWNAFALDRAGRDDDIPGSTAYVLSL
jgi:hypothetical protein